jgi:hypothetical protein
MCELLSHLAKLSVESIACPELALKAPCRRETKFGGVLGFDTAALQLTQPLNAITYEWG